MSERRGVKAAEVTDFDILLSGAEGQGQVVLSDENIRGQLADIANLGMTPDLVNVVNQGGVEYYVSKGDEHFVDFEGDDAEGVIQELRPQLSGYRLMRRKVKKDQDSAHILLVKNGVVDSPVASVLPKSGFICEGDQYTIISDPERIKLVFQKIAPIVKDSIDKAKLEHTRKKEKSKSVARKFRNGVLAASVAVGAIAFAPGVFSSISNQYRQYQLDRRLEEEAEQALRQAELDRRVSNTREFDSNHSIPSSVPTTDMDTPGIATASNTFEDVRVPDIDAESIPASLAGDITEGPREINLDDLGSGDCQDIKDVITDGETEFRVVHNGGSGRYYNVFMDTTNHTLTVCENGAQSGSTDAQEAEASSIFVEARQG